MSLMDPKKSKAKIYSVPQTLHPDGLLLQEPFQHRSHQTMNGMSGSLKIPLTFSLNLWACFEVLLIFIFLILCCNVCYVMSMVLFVMDLKCGSQLLRDLGFGWILGNISFAIHGHAWAFILIFAFIFLMQCMSCWIGNVLCRA